MTRPDEPFILTNDQACHALKSLKAVYDTASEPERAHYRKVIEMLETVLAKADGKDLMVFPDYGDRPATLANS